ncbi:hypothetical protein B1J93_04795 [Leptospira kirschneri serovar Pomona]|uniref:HTH cro/C1-type domain-containing protein n=1 Tax=Leptospira kirschneri serovar Pomona TaxID=561005 RepID=A0A1T1DXE5_9LEPT|nr:helix-turn-helix transcriptional regulator [Leptospira kirschneri]OOV45521.1 hypothetical protein B1J93_04795 [Leptospira kirschneri serovar Pomona]
MAGNASKFGRKVRELREKKKATLKELSEAVNKSINYISDIELGRRNPPKEEDIFKIAIFLDANPIELLALAASEKSFVEINVNPEKIKHAELVVVMARTINELSDPHVEKLLEDLKNFGGMNGIESSSADSETTIKN